MWGRLLLISMLVAGAAVLQRPSASAATLLVDDDRAQCPAATFTSIQAAIVAAASGDTIEVCRGTYAEQISVDPGKDRLTIRSQMPREAVIEPPAALANLEGVSLIAVRGARDITIDGFRLTGPFPISLCVPTPLSGIRVERGGSAIVRQTTITVMRAADLALTAGHCSPGYGVLVRSSSPEPRTAVTLVENQIERYLTAGVLIDGAGAIATIQRNGILANAPTAEVERASIEVRQGATATIRDNDLGRNGRAILGAPPTAGIRLAGVSGVQVEGNRIEGNDHGIALREATGATLRANRVTQSAVYGIAVLDGSLSNTIEDNHVGDSGAARATGGPVTGVTADIFPGGEETQPPPNRPSNLDPIDCIDFTVGAGPLGVANQWRRNVGVTAIPAGICGPS